MTEKFDKRKFYKKNREMILYLVCGGLTTAVNFAGFWVFAEVGKLSVGCASVWAWGLAVLFAYVVNRVLVFQSENDSWEALLREAAAFAGARIFSGIFEVGMMVFLADFLRFPVWWAKILIGIAVVVLNFAASKRIIFCRHGQRGGESHEKKVPC